MEESSSSSSSSSATVPGLPSLGEHSVEILERHTGFYLKHGSSLMLMTMVGDFLNSSDEFKEVDVSSDWEKWRRRSPDFSLYYAAIFDQSTNEIVGALRAVIDGQPCPRPPHKRRLIIDYIAVLPIYQSRGFASTLVEFVLNVSIMSAANVYVLAIEESCVYFMSKNFLLCENVNLNARLKVFPDTHLLRHVENSEDNGDVADLSMLEEYGDDDDDDEDQDEDEQSAPPPPPPPPQAVLDFSALLNQYNINDS